MKHLLFFVVGVSAGLFFTEFQQVPAKYVLLFALIVLLLNQVVRYFVRKNKTVRQAPGNVRTRVRRKFLPQNDQAPIDPNRLKAIMNRPACPIAVAPERAMPFRLRN